MNNPPIFYIPVQTKCPFCNQNLPVIQTNYNKCSCNKFKCSRPAQDRYCLKYIEWDFDNYKLNIDWFGSWIIFEHEPRQNKYPCKMFGDDASSLFDLEKDDLNTIEQTVNYLMFYR